MAPINPRFFVYGTLMSSASGSLGKPERERLQREARKLGEGTTEGRLYLLGRYPGLVPSDEPDELVYGEVYVLTRPEQSLTWLDAYEGIGPGESGSGYVRAERSIALKSGETLTAWVYIYEGDVTEVHRIQNGRWISRAT